MGTESMICEKIIYPVCICHSSDFLSIERKYINSKFKSRKALSLLVLRDYLRLNSWTAMIEGMKLEKVKHNEQFFSGVLKIAQCVELIYSWATSRLMTTEVSKIW